MDIRDPILASGEIFSWTYALKGRCATALKFTIAGSGARQKMKNPMKIALLEATKGAAVGEVPVGAVITDDKTGNIISSAHNRVEQLLDPTAHAEMLAIKEATSVLKTKALSGCTIFVTLEPCAMCAQAISLSKFKKLIFGAYDPKGGGVEHGGRIFDKNTCNHRPEIIGGFHEIESRQLLESFFQELRKV